MRQLERRDVLRLGLGLGALSLPGCCVTEPLGEDGDSTPGDDDDAPATFEPPYALPAPGEAVFIGTNSAESVRPPTHSIANWNYALFYSYGAGTYVAAYSAGGAYVIAGSGGFGAPPNFGGALFDFADATWKRIDNANGMPWIARDLNAPGFTDEINAFGEINYPGVSAGIPAPSSLFANVQPLAATQGGGPRGSALILRCAAAGYDSNYGSAFAHRFDLATRLWSRQSTNETVQHSDFRTTFHDPVTNRYYMPRYELWESGTIDYLDGADWTWKTAGIGSPGNEGRNKTGFLDVARRLIVLQTSTGKLRALDLENLSAGPVLLNLVGTLQADDSSRWHQYPADGCWYNYTGNGGNTLYKIEPPAADPLTARWTVSEVTIGGVTLPSQPAEAISGGGVHNARFFYVPSVDCFAWIAGNANQVVLLKP